MLVHSYDVGVRNLAQCVLRVTKDDTLPRGVRVDIVHWRILDCATAAGAQARNLNTAKIDEITSICSVAWGRLCDKIVALDPYGAPDQVFIELQPKTLNNKMQVVSYLLQSFLLSNFVARCPDRSDPPRVEFVHADLKLQEADFSEFFATNNASRARSEGRRMTKAERLQDKDKKYDLNKKHAKAQTPVVLRESGAEKWADWFEAQGGKRDDLADAFLMGYYRARELVLDPEGTTWSDLTKPTAGSAAAAKRAKRARSPAAASRVKRTRSPAAAAAPGAGPKRIRAQTAILEAQRHFS